MVLRPSIYTFTEPRQVHYLNINWIVFTKRMQCGYKHRYRLINEKLPHSVNDYYNFFENQYSTRQKQSTLLLPRVRTEHGKSSISFMGSQIWNNLPEDVKRRKTLNSFRRTYKNILIQEYS